MGLRGAARAGYGGSGALAARVRRNIGDPAELAYGPKETPTEDSLFGKGRIRADGRKVHPAYLLEVKKPAESKGPWDLYKVRATIPAAEAFRPLAEGNCPLVAKN